ncbi:hypothetical protein JCM10908_002742 [Rhodotorula pacifica]|uniref:uncharacterized protein n=1 Tax=Rhodotorula pacifica TaxID=1495444 RepID=UPI00318219AA
MGRPLPAGPTSPDLHLASESAVAAPPRLARQLRNRTPSPPPETDWTLSGVQPRTVAINSPLYGFAPEVAAMIAAPAGPSSSAANDLQTPPNPAALRALDARLDQAVNADHSRVGAPTAGSELQEQRRMLDEVRDRLEETRQRIAAAAAASRAEEQRTNPSRSSQDALSRDIRFASRVDVLAHTLNSIAERTMSLSSAIESLRASSPPVSPRPQRSLPALTSSTSPRAMSSTADAAESEQPTASSAASPSRAYEENASHTDDIRTVVRQLILMSRRVSTVIAQHREQVAVSAANLPPPPETTTSAATDGPTMQEHLPVILPSYLHERPLPPDTTPNTAGLLLPQPTVLDMSPAGQPPELSTSPQPMSSPSTSPPPGDETEPDGPEGPGESYPGERAQLMRIVQLQSDIAARAGQLRALRARGRELSRERRVYEGRSEARRSITVMPARPVPNNAVGTVARERAPDGEAEKDDEEARDRLAGFDDGNNSPISAHSPYPVLRRRSEVHGRSREGLHSASKPVSEIQRAVDAIRSKQEYQTWRQCGR